jgi:hypothetical protein
MVNHACVSSVWDVCSDLVHVHAPPSLPCLVPMVDGDPSQGTAQAAAGSQPATAKLPSQPEALPSRRQQVASQPSE